MKQIDLKSLISIEPIQGSGHLWYWATNYLYGDLYEAEEIFKEGKCVVSNRLLLLNYPEGKVYEPIVPIENLYFGEPIFYDNTVFC